ncbi:MAG: hypothetical protein Q9222_004898 [Ikaeria aurantiellina]
MAAPTQEHHYDHGRRAVLGRAAYLGAITTVFAHPGRRFGQLVESLALAIIGTALGLAWSLLGLYLGSLVIKTNPPAAYSIRGIFLACALIFHGFLRSKTPRLFVGLLLLIIISVVSLTSTATAVTQTTLTQIVYPILVAAGVILVVNLILFPEFSSSFLGETTIKTLYDTTQALQDAGEYFTLSATFDEDEDSGNSPSHKGKGTEQVGNERIKKSEKRTFPAGLFKPLVRLEGERRSDRGGPEDQLCPSIHELVGAKAQLRAKLSTCKAAQMECNFEIAFAVLPPRKLKPVSDRSMKKLVAATVAVIGACESKFALLGDNDAPNTDSGRHSEASARETASDPTRNVMDPSLTSNQMSKDDRTELDLIKPKREIEFGDARLLQYLLKRIRAPYLNFFAIVSRAVECQIVCIAYCYDVAKLPSTAKVPKALAIEEVDIYVEELGEALSSFDIEIMSALEGAVEMEGLDGQKLDIMPREEVFLIASFLLNVRQAATHIEEMLKYSRTLVLERQSRHSRRRFYAARIKWSKWLYSGGDEEEAMPAAGRKRNRRGEDDGNNDEEDDSGSGNSEENLLKSISIKNDIEVGRSTESSPPKPSQSKSSAKGKPLAMSSNIEKRKSFLLRFRGRLADTLEWIQSSDDLLYAFKLAIAVFLVTWPAFVARWNRWYSLNRGLWAALQLIFVTEVSIGTSVMTFILRGIGTTLGCLWGWAALEARDGNRIVVTVMVALGLVPCTYVQLGTKYPKAGMVCIVSICVVALSTELQTVPGSATENFLKRWLAFFIGGVVALIVEMALLPVKARTRLVESLTATLCQISQMETCVATGIEEGMNLDIERLKILDRFEHASSKANSALAAAETFFRCSLSTKLALPQFFPSARLAHLRMINRVREVVHQTIDQDSDKDIDELARQKAVRRKYMAWDAASAARVEIIEYLEELIDLTKLLVGANEFRSGLLMRSTYYDYTQGLGSSAADKAKAEEETESKDEGRDAFVEAPAQSTGMPIRRRVTRVRSASSGEEKIPASLQRIQSRKIEAGIKRQATNEGWMR